MIRSGDRPPPPELFLLQSKSDSPLLQIAESRGAPMSRLTNGRSGFSMNVSRQLRRTPMAGFLGSR